jgi:hypothetical protein
LRGGRLVRRVDAGHAGQLAGRAPCEVVWLRRLLASDSAPKPYACVGPPGPRRLRHQWCLFDLLPCSLMAPLDFVQLW